MALEPPAADSTDLLERLLAPTMTVERFFSEHWQKQPLHIARCNAGYYRDVFDAYRDTEELWANAQGRADGTLMHFQGTGKVVELPSPFFAFAHRCSVVVNKGDRFCGALLRLCHALQAHFPFVYTNVYLTPSCSQSVPRHSDDREVLILQVLGSKRWTVYNDPVRLPFKDEEIGKRGGVLEPPLTRLLECDVRQGDLLYLPRGFVHEGVAEAEPSMHITVALQSSDWDVRTLLLSAFAEVTRSAELASARECLPPALLCPGRGARSNAGTEVARLEERYNDLVVRSAQQAAGMLSASVANFHERLADLRAERDADARRCTKPAPLGLSLSSLLLWNPHVDVEDVVPAAGNRVEAVDRIVHFTRRSTDGVLRMALACSKQVFDNIALLRERHLAVPIAVRGLQFGDHLSKLALALFLLNSDSCILVA